MLEFRTDNLDAEVIQDVLDDFSETLTDAENLIIDLEHSQVTPINCAHCFEMYTMSKAT